jgi:heptosyltransferase-2
MLSAPLGGAPGSAERTPTLAVGDDEVVRGRELLTASGLDEARPIACLAPGSNWVTKRWFADGFGGIGRRMLAMGISVVVVGTAREADLCGTVASLAGTGAVSLAGRLSVRELAAVLERCLVTVANDSGPAHLAAAVGSPVVAVFGPTSPASGLVPIGEEVRIVEHPDLDCRPCSRHGPRVCPLGHFRCMREVGVDDVWAAVEPVLSGGRTRADHVSG